MYKEIFNNYKSYSGVSKQAKTSKITTVIRAKDYIPKSNKKPNKLNHSIYTNKY